jgi:hypothetical protein
LSVSPQNSTFATKTKIVRETVVTATKSETGIVIRDQGSSMIATIGIGKEIAEIGTVIFETRRRTSLQQEPRLQVRLVAHPHQAGVFALIQYYY